MKQLTYHNLRILIMLLYCSVFLFSSCSSARNSIYLKNPLDKSDFQLTSQKAFSKDSSYYVLIPEGWFYSYDNKSNSSDIFLVQNDFNASLSLVPINTDSKADFDSQKNELVNLSKIMKEAELNSKLIQIGNPEFFSINKIECAAYQYYNNSSLPVRTILFKFNNRFYELNAYITESGLNGKLIPDNVYDVQNSIIYSIK